MPTLGDRLATQIKKIVDKTTTSAIATNDFDARVILAKIKLNVTWSINTRSPSLTFLVGDDTKSKLDYTTVGKGVWTEEVSG